jgi:hypothetical protein
MSGISRCGLGEVCAFCPEGSETPAEFDIGIGRHLPVCAPCLDEVRAAVGEFLAGHSHQEVCDCEDAPDRPSLN